MHQLKQQLTLWSDLASLAAIHGGKCCWRLHGGQNKATKSQSAIRANKKSLQIVKNTNEAQNGSRKGHCA
jgi:hypothetical protein